MGYDYSMLTGFGYELFDSSSMEQRTFMEEKYSYLDDVGEDSIVEEFKRQYPLLELAITGNFWSDEVLWSILVAETVVELGSGNRVETSQHVCTNDELAQLEMAREEFKNFIHLKKPCRLSLEKVM